MSKLIVNEIEKYDAGQLTITTGTDVSIGSDLTVGGTIAGTLSTAAQTNITSVGTLSSLSVSGNLTVDTDTLFVDSVNNRVGIGTSSPDRNLTIKNSADGVNGLSFQSFASNSEVGYIRYEQTNDILDIVNKSGFGGSGIKFSTNNAERVRIDSSGNVGIGTSSPSYKLQVDHTSGYSLRLPYTSENLEMYMGTVTGGKIGIQAKVISSGVLYPLYLNPEGGNVVIHSGNLSFANGSGIDFSATEGGGATSSLLDDYEEGTYTPTLSPSIDGSITVSSINSSVTYTKIGGVVNVGGEIVVDSVSSPTGHISVSLPYAAAGSVRALSAVSYSINNVVSANVSDFVGWVLGGFAFCRIYVGDSTTEQADSSQQMQADTRIRFNLTYKTA